MTTFICLSVRQPHCEAIAAGIKTREQRTWKTDYRGPLLIVSSKTSEAGSSGLPRGVAICLVDLVDCVDTFKCPEAPELDCEPDDTVDYPDGEQRCERCGYPVDDVSGHDWILSNPRRVQPVPVKGQLNLFRRELDITLEVARCR